MEALKQTGSLSCSECWGPPSCHRLQCIALALAEGEIAVLHELWGRRLRDLELTLMSIYMGSLSFGSNLEGTVKND